MISIHRDTQHIGDKTRYWKDFEPVDFGGDLERISEVICTFAWSPNQWLDGGRRRQASWARALYCVLDFDDGVVTIEEAKKKFADCKHVIGATRSHQRPKGKMPPCDRFRVLLRFERPIEDLATFRASQEHWVKRFGSDDTCIDGARFYWPCTSIVSIQAEGDAVDVLEPKPFVVRRDYSLLRQTRQIPRYLHPVLMKGAPEGERNATCFRLGAELTRCGFERERVFQIVEASPISLPYDEMRRAVENGIRAAIAEGSND